MLDIKRIVNDKEKVEKALQKRMIDISLDDLVNWYQERNKALVMVEQLKANKNKLNKEIGELKAKGEDISDLSKKMKNTNNKINELELQLTELENNIKDLLVTLPNIPDDDVVAGGKENNEVISIKVKSLILILDLKIMLI